MCLNKTYSKVRIGEYLAGTFPIQNGLKQGNALEYAIRRVQENQVGLKLNGTHQLLFYADDVHLLGDTTATLKKNTGTLIDASKEVRLEVNAEKTKFERGLNSGNACYHSVQNRLYFRLLSKNAKLEYKKL
jgi:hypothetical protein